MEDKQEMIDIVETVYRGARKGRGLVVSPKDYSTKYRYWFFKIFKIFCFSPLFVVLYFFFYVPWYFDTTQRLQTSEEYLSLFWLCRWKRTLFLIMALTVLLCAICVFCACNCFVWFHKHQVVCVLQRRISVKQVRKRSDVLNKASEVTFKIKMFFSTYKVFGDGTEMKTGSAVILQKS